MLPILIRRGKARDIDSITQLFDLYRQFYKLSSDLSRARSFISKRLSKEDSVIFVAEAENKTLVAFMQLYFNFSSLSMAPTLILNDLYVCPEFRRNKIAARLLDAAHVYALSIDAVSIALETQSGNQGAQSLYQKFGYQLEKEFLMYSLDLGRHSNNTARQSPF